MAPDGTERECVLRAGHKSVHRSMNGAASRRKGVQGEREVAAKFQAAGLAVRGLEGQGDHLVILKSQDHPALHIECKRQETLRLPTWLRQAEAECPGGCIPVVCFRQNQGEWYATVPLDDFAALVAGT